MLFKSINLYFKKSKYILIVLGMLFLTLMLWSGCAFIIIRKDMANLINAFNSVCDKEVINEKNLIIQLFDSLYDLNPFNIDELQNRLLNKSTYFEIYKAIFNENGYDASSFLLAIDNYATGSLRVVQSLVILFIIFMSFGYMGGYFFTRSMLRNEYTYRSDEKIQNMTVVHIILSMIFTVLFIIASGENVYGAFGGYVIVIFVSHYLTLYTIRAAYNKEISMKETFLFKNLAPTLLVDGIYSLITILLSLLFIFVFKRAGIVVSLILIPYLSSLIALNSEAYITRLIDKKPHQTAKEVSLSVPFNKLPSNLPRELVYENGIVQNKAKKVQKQKKAKKTKIQEKPKSNKKEYVKDTNHVSFIDESNVYKITETNSQEVNLLIKEDEENNDIF